MPASVLADTRTRVVSKCFVDKRGMTRAAVFTHILGGAWIHQLCINIDTARITQCDS